MEQIMNEAIIIAAILTPLVSGLTQAIKRSVPKLGAYPEAVSLATGVTLATIVSLGFGQELPYMVLAGVVSGLAASGLYDNIKGGKNNG